MIKIYKKTTLLFLLICCTAFIAKAQLGFNYSQYDIGFGFGTNSVSGDVLPKTSTPSVHFNFTYNFTPYTNFVLEAQLGRLEGGDSLHTISGRQFTNDFSAFIFRGQLQLGEIMDYSRGPLYNSLKGLYVSAGIGYVSNHITAISRYSNDIPPVFTDGLNNSMGPFIPLRIGYELKIFNMYRQPSVKIDLGYGYNYILSDNLDGYIVTPNHHDVYTQLTLGFKFAIGGAVTSYRKQIPYN